MKSRWFLISSGIFGAGAAIVVHLSTGSPLEVQFTSLPNQLAGPAATEVQRVQLDRTPVGSGKAHLHVENNKPDDEDTLLVAHRSGVVQVVTRRGRVVVTFDAANPVIPIPNSDDFLVIDRSRSKVSEDLRYATVFTREQNSGKAGPVLKVSPLADNDMPIAFGHYAITHYRVEQEGKGFVGKIVFPEKNSDSSRIMITSTDSSASDKFPLTNTDLALGLLGGGISFAAAFFWSETAAFQRRMEGVPRGTLTVGKILELRNSEAASEDLPIFAPPQDGAGPVATLERGSDKFGFVYFSLDEAFKWTPEQLEQAFLKRLNDIHESKGLKRPGEAIERLQEEYGAIRLMRGFRG